MIFSFLFLLVFIGHGAYFASLSPYVVDSFPKHASTIFVSGQIAVPLGYFMAGIVSDRTKLLRTPLVICILLHSVSQWLFFDATTGESAMFWHGFSRFFLAGSLHLITISCLESEGLNFGSNRFWGTFGFFAINLLFFSLLMSGERFAFLQNPSIGGKAGTLFLLIECVVAFFVQKERRNREEYHFPEALRILTKYPVWAFYVITFVFYFAYQVVDMYLGAYLKHRGGMQVVYIGWVVAVVLELPMLPLSVRLAGKFGHRSLFILAILAGIIQFVWLSLDAGIGLKVHPLYSQICHGVHFTGFYMGCIWIARHIFPSHLYGTGYGIAMVIVSLGSMAGNIVYADLLFSNPMREFALRDSAFFALFSLSLVLHIATFAALFILPKRFFETGLGRPVSPS